MSEVFTRAHLDRGEGKIHFERVQDVAPILERNKRCRAWRKQAIGDGTSRRSPT
jgi:hypothetical protein